MNSIGIRGVTIDGYTFDITERALHGGNHYAKITSSYIKTNTSKVINTIFWVYLSNSELGIWRLCFTDSDTGTNYKGSGKYDYVQTTLIHFELQAFINRNYVDFTRYDNKPCPNVHAESSIIHKFYIDNQSRIIEDSPFIDFHNRIECGELRAKGNAIYNGKTITDTEKYSLFNAYSTIRVGYIPNTPEGLLREFGVILEALYTIGEHEIVYQHKNLFSRILEFNGNIERVTLYRKEPIAGGKTNTIVLYYFLIQNTCGTSSHIENPTHRSHTQTLCEPGYKLMPILLTVPEAKCNSIGLYDKYILSGQFICKLFDYSSANYMQCTPTEVANGSCSSIYSYIGSRYNIFPYKDIIVLRIEEDAEKRRIEEEKQRVTEAKLNYDVYSSKPNVYAHTTSVFNIPRRMEKPKSHNMQRRHQFIQRQQRQQPILRARSARSYTSKKTPSRLFRAQSAGKRKDTRKK